MNRRKNTSRFVNASRVASVQRRAFSLIEIIAAIAIVTVVVALTATKYFQPAVDSKRNTCYVITGEIETQVQLWFREQGRWPSANLRDIGAHSDFFPSGLPTCPFDGSKYRLDPRTHRVVGHNH